MVRADTKLLLGFSYALLRRPFRQGHFSARGKGSVRRLLVSFGGADSLGHTDAVLDALSLMPQRDFVVDVVVTSVNQKLHALKQRIAATFRMNLHVDTPDMAGLMAAADLALGSGGASSWERCRAGLPTLVTIAAENQLGIINYLEKAAVIRIIDSEYCRCPSALATLLSSALVDERWRVHASQQGMEIVDGRGADRVVQELLSFIH
jgi:spore coat polysaccharide biosynthesis predicted glycosyltransferase SpsG